MSNTHGLVIDSTHRNTYSNTYNYNVSLNNIDLRNITSFYIESLVISNHYINVSEIHAMRSRGSIDNTSENKKDLIFFDDNDVLNTNIGFSKISDLKYINIVVSIGNTGYGTQNQINKSTGIMIFDNIQERSHNNSKVLVTNGNNGANTHLITEGNIQKNGESLIYNSKEDILFMRNVFPKKILNPPVNITSLSISLYKPDGEPLTLLNDSLTLNKVKRTSVTLENQDNAINTVSFAVTSENDKKLRSGLYITNESNNPNIFITKFVNNTVFLNKTPQNTTNPIFKSQKIELVFNEYFSSEEYKVGDTILLKNITSNTSNPSLDAFLKRPEGHTIVGLVTDPPHNTDTTLYNVIEILPKIEVGAKEHIQFFDLNDTGIQYNGVAINRDNQHSIFIQFETNDKR